MSNDDWTMECWIKRDPDNPDRPMIDNMIQSGYPNGPGISMSKEMVGKLEVDKWHQITAVRDAGVVKMFVNGEQVNNVATVTRHGDGTFTLADYQTKVLFPDRESLVVHIAKMRILHPEIEITGDIE